MLLLRLLRFLLWPIRLPFLLLRRASGLGRGARAAEAAVAGGASKVAPRDQGEDIRYSGIFKVHNVEPSDEPRIDDAGLSTADQLTVAESIAARARRYYAMRPPLFPSGRKPNDPNRRPEEDARAGKALRRDFYEEVEAAYLEDVASFDNDGGEDQLMRMLRKGRCCANDNARILFCELTPLLLAVLLAWHWAMLQYDPFHLLAVPNAAHGLEAYLREGSSAIGMAAGALAVGLLFVTFIYRFSYTHIQRQNAQDLNAFIQIEFARLNDTFRVAHRECLRAETRVDNTQHSNLGPLASAWALAYHWIGVRQFMEEMAIRNMMFQIRRNTALYVVLGMIISICVVAVMACGVYFTTSLDGAATPPLVALAHILIVAGAFILITFGLIMRHPFAITASRFRADEWNRFDTLALGKAIAEQVANDKLQIVIQRDTRR